LNTYEAWVKAERDSRGIERQKLMDAEARGIKQGKLEGNSPAHAPRRRAYGKDREMDGAKPRATQTAAARLAYFS